MIEKLSRRTRTFLKRQGAIEEECRKCGRTYLWCQEHDDEDLCGGDICYDCVHLRFKYDNTKPMSVMNLLNDFDGQAMEGCKECGTLSPIHPHEKFRFIKEQGHCMNCTVVKQFISDKI